MIYWIEHAPNPWVRLVAIAVLGSIAYFDYASGADIPDMGFWLGGFGACTDDWETGVPEFKGGELIEKEELFRRLTAALGPVAGVIAFREATKATDEELLNLHKKVWNKAKAKKA